MSDRRRAAALALASLAACVYPSDTPTGIEFSWSFHEIEPSDGEEALRVLSCQGVAVERIAVELVDLGKPEREGVFRFECADGFQTANDLARKASEAFVELHPREYDVTLVEDVVVDPQTLASRTVEVLSRSVTLEQWELTRLPVDHHIEIVGAATGCGELALALYYADPEVALAEPPLDDENQPVEVLYRQNLVSDRGLGLGGGALACAQLEGVHLFTGLDRGSYALDVTIDGTTCTRLVELPGAGSTVIDVTGMPCG